MPNSLAANLVRLRKKRKLSQREVAEQLNISQSLLSHYERGIREGSIDFLIRAAGFYSVSCDVLLGCDSEEAQMRNLLQTASSLESDSSLSLLTVARAASAVSAQSGEPSEMTKAIALLIFKSLGHQDVPAHWINAALDEIIAGLQLKKNSAMCVQTIKKAAKSIVKETVSAFG